MISIRLFTDQVFINVWIEELLCVQQGHSLCLDLKDAAQILIVTRESRGV